MNRIAVAIAAVIAALAVAAGVLAQSGGARVEVRVWERADDPARNFVSARAGGGSWRDLGTVPVAMDGRSGAYRYGDIALTVGAGVVEVRVWERADDPARNFVSARAEGGSWRDLGTVPVAMDGVSGAYRYGDIALTVPAGAPTPPPTPTPTPVPTATPTPSASERAASCSFEDSLPRVRAAIVHVYSPARGSLSTAFHIGGGEFVTTAHGVTMGGRVSLNGDGYSAYAVVVARVKATETVVTEDVALLRAGAAPTAALDWAHSDFAVSRDARWIGDAIAVVGYPWGSVQREMRGTILDHDLSDADDSSEIDGALTVVGVDTRPGHSGSPIVDACGAVRGMVVGVDGWTEDLRTRGPNGETIQRRLGLD